MSIKCKSHNLSQINTKNSNILNKSDAQLVNNKTVLFAHFNSPNQLNICSAISTSKTTKLNQASAMKGKSMPKSTTPSSPGVSFTTDTAFNMAHQSPPNSNLSSPLIDSLQVLSFEKMAGKVFNKNLIASSTSKDAVLKEVRDCIIRDDADRLKQLYPYLHSYWRNLRSVVVA